MIPNSLFLLFQDLGEEAASTVASQSLWDIISSSGFMGIANMLVQLILSFLAVYIFVERYLTINRASVIDESFMNNIKANVGTGNIEAAKALCRNVDTPVARMVEKGLMRIGKPLRDIDASIENVGNLEIFKLEKNLSLLASIAGAAPMIGFLGTVTGMIQAFYTMATENSVTPTALAGGIYQALITTAFGLTVGIAAFIGYNYLVSKIEKIVFSMERSTTEFMDMLQEPAN